MVADSSMLITPGSTFEVKKTVSKENSSGGSFYVFASDCDGVPLIQ